MIDFPRMNATEIIDEIKHLPPAERTRVANFLRSLEAGRIWSGAELTAAAAQMVEESDPVQAEELKQRIVAGFYGDSNA